MRKLLRETVRFVCCPLCNMQPPQPDSDPMHVSGERSVGSPALRSAVCELILHDTTDQINVDSREAQPSRRLSSDNKDLSTFAVSHAADRCLRGVFSATLTVDLSLYLLSWFALPKPKTQNRSPSPVSGDRLYRAKTLPQYRFDR
jgi:hypothetical protein